jgi:hypothetical protein
VFGNLEVMEEDGRVRRHDVDGIERWTRA